VPVLIALADDAPFALFEVGGAPRHVEFEGEVFGAL